MMLRGSTSPGGVNHAVSFTDVPWRRSAAPGASHRSAAGAAESHVADGAASRRSSTPREARSCEGNLRRFWGTWQLKFKISPTCNTYFLCIMSYVYMNVNDVVRCIYTHLSIYLSIYLSTYLSISVYLSIPIYLSTYRSIDLSIYLSI